MATVDSYRSVCDRFNIGRATAWPSGDRAIDVMQGFEIASRFPKVIGAIDGTHIHIDSPKENAADYINRKGFHSIQLQLVCDHKTSIAHCYVGHPGSVHDQRVFRLSEVYDYLNEDEKFPNNSHILGDAAYEIHEHLLIPFRDNGHLTERQKNYNYYHSAARVTIERCIGLLKGRMRSLLHCLPMTRIDLMAEYIVACCVIHNICILQQDELAVISIAEVNPGNINIQHRDGKDAGIHKRNAIMDIL
ncbi:hypothetical protein JTB14_004556 [Gonioctena quinquepunctata]|nr:hypothetical protein JTB14_004556 [Gonioctena quinquepunctata]